MKKNRNAPHVYTNEQKEFIVNNFDKYSNKALTELFNDIFHTSLSYRQIKSFKIKNHLSYQKYHTYTQEEKYWLSKNYDKHYVKDLVQMFNEKFNANLSEANIMSYKKKHNLTHHHGTFKVWELPPEILVTNKKRKSSSENMKKYNKSKRIEGEKAGYKDGNNYVDKYGRHYVIVRDEIKRKNIYIKRDRYVYEKTYGKIPKDNVIIHIDGDISNDNIDNLKTVKRGVVVSLNKRQLRTNYVELNKLGIEIAELQQIVNELKNKLKI